MGNEVLVVVWQLVFSLTENMRLNKFIVALLRNQLYIYKYNNIING